jgi:hypothetical protein
MSSENLSNRLDAVLALLKRYRSVWVASEPQSSGLIWPFTEPAPRQPRPAEWDALDAEEQEAVTVLMHTIARGRRS